MTRTGEKKVQKGSIRKTLPFKYYIHDTANGYVLEMSGPLTESSVAELACCWHTAKTTLKNRTLILDLRGLTSIDEGATQWLASMSHEGAKYLPESFMRAVLAGLPGRQEEASPNPIKRSFLGRLLARSIQNS